MESSAQSHPVRPRPKFIMQSEPFALIAPDKPISPPHPQAAAKKGSGAFSGQEPFFGMDEQGKSGVTVVGHLFVVASSTPRRRSHVELTR